MSDRYVMVLEKTKDARCRDRIVGVDLYVAGSVRVRLRVGEVLTEETAERLAELLRPEDAGDEAPDLDSAHRAAAEALRALGEVPSHLLSTDESKHYLLASDALGALRFSLASRRAGAPAEEDAAQRSVGDLLDEAKRASEALGAALNAIAHHPQAPARVRNAAEYQLGGVLGTMGIENMRKAL